MKRLTVLPLVLLASAALAEPATLTRHDFGAWGFDLSARDVRARPGASFFDYANGGWYRTAEIPADQTSTGGMTDLRVLSEQQLRLLIEGLAEAPPSAGTSDAQALRHNQIGALYASFMDEARIEARGITPLAADLSRIRAARSRDDIVRIMGQAQTGFGISLFGIGVGPDDKAPSVNVLGLGQSGLGLPNRDYYLKDAYKPQRDAFRAYLGRTLAMIDWPEPDAAADHILAFETKIAEASWSSIQHRDAVARYNPMSVAELQALAPAFPWKAWMTAAGVGTVEHVVAGEKSAFPKLAAIFAATDLPTLKAWQAFHTTNDASAFLPKRFVDSQFAFRKAMTGATELRARWKRGVGFVEGALGEALGQEYVAAHFPLESKVAMEALVANLKTAMGARIEKLAWMAPATKAQALEKLAKMRVMVGYPDTWRDYAALSVDPTDLYGNAKRAFAFEWAWEVGKLKRPVDPDEWGMTPQTVNAYADPSRNVIVFPAAILQAPYFDPKADPAINYGAIGGVIGHEITHMFDDQGRHYDATGRLRDWWTEADARRFEAETAKLATQYDGFAVAPGYPVQGKLTLGENIADLGGVLLALDAYHASLEGRPAPSIDGLDGDQRVLLGWAQAWRQKQRLEAMKDQVASDPHSPARFRVDGVMRNVDSWYDTFGIAQVDPLYIAPDKRVRIW